MQILNQKQGTEEWLRDRLTKFNASEAPAMMGASKKVKRNELLRMKATGEEQEFSDWVRDNLLDKGHAVEAQARPLAEERIAADLGLHPFDAELYPVVVAHDDDPQRRASLDGLAECETVHWECKLWNEAKAAEARAGRVPEEDFWQVVHQCDAAGTFCLYTLSDGTPEKTLHVWYELTEDDRKALLAGWDRFAKDLEEYKRNPPEEVIEAVAEPVGSLPAIRYRLNGLALKSNLDEYKAAAERLVEEARQPLETDQDFATADARIKTFKAAEEKIDLVVEQVLGEVQDIDAFRRDILDIREKLRQARLASSKQVEAEKKRRREDIRTSAYNGLVQHIRDIETELGLALPAIDDGIAAAMKGKKSLASLKDAADTAAANAKIEADQWAERIRGNLAILAGLAGDGHAALFPDRAALVAKSAEDFTAVVKARIAEHEAEQQRRESAARERIRREEEVKARQAAEAQRAAEATQHSEPEPAPQTHSPSAGEPVSRAARKAGQTPELEAIDSGRPPAPPAYEIIAVLAEHYRVSERTVTEWLGEMDLEDEAMAAQL